MEENIRYGFFDQIFVSFFQPSKYKKFLPARKLFLIGFILLMSALSFLMEYMIPFGAWDVSIGGFENLVTNGIPSFSLKEGVFTMDGPLDLEVSSALHLVADSSVTEYKEEDLSDDYMEEFLISKNNMVMRHSNMVYEVDFSKLDYNVDNQTLVEMLPVVKTILIMTFVLLYLFKIAGFMISAFFFALICKSGVRTQDGRKTPFGAALVFAIYGRAPFMLLDSLVTCIGFSFLSTWVLLIGVCLTIKYIFTAEKSLLGVGEKYQKED